MQLVEQLAYFLPLSFFIGTTTALIKSETPAYFSVLAIRHTLTLAGGVALLAAALVLLNLWV